MSQETVIKLPPLPSGFGPGEWIEMDYESLVARDLEVARLVLEAAAHEAERNGEYLTEQVAEVLYATAINIRTLEVGHD